MAVSRTLYITFYTIYLALLALSLWFLLYYSNVPYWVWFFFAIALIISFISLIIREAAIKHIVNTKLSTKTIQGSQGSQSQKEEVQIKEVSEGTGPSKSTMGSWGITYIFMQIASMILIIVGIIFVIIYSSIPWWIWVILGVAILLNIMAVVIAALIPKGIAFSLVVSIIAFIVFLVGFSFLVVYSQAPFWVWLIFAIAIIFLMIADIFEKISEKPVEQSHKTIADDSSTKVNESSVELLLVS